MARHGYSEPIWAGDATRALNLLGALAFFPDPPFKAQDLLPLREVE